MSHTDSNTPLIERMERIGQQYYTRRVEMQGERDMLVRESAIVIVIVIAGP